MYLNLFTNLMCFIWQNEWMNVYSKAETGCELWSNSGWYYEQKIVLTEMYEYETIA